MGSNIIILVYLTKLEHIRDVIIEIKIFSETAEPDFNREKIKISWDQFDLSGEKYTGRVFYVLRQLNLRIKTQ
jgi:hypothetical protein